MRAQIEGVASVARFDIVRMGPPLRVGLLGLLLGLMALQRGGYYPESWGLPTAACAWAVTLTALLGARQRLRRLELAQLAALALLGSLALVSAIWTPGGLGSALPQAQLLAFDLSAVTAVLLLFPRATPLVAATWGALLVIASLALGTRLFPSGLPLDPSSQNRLYEPLGYWNSLGLWAVMGICLSAGLVARARSTLLRAAAAAGCVPCAVTLYFTFGRAAWVALAVGLVVALAVDPRRLGLAAWLLLVAPWPAAAVWLASRSDALTSLQPVLAEARTEGRSLALAIIALSLAAALATGALARWERTLSVPVAARRAFAAALVSLVVLGLAATVVRFGAPWTMARNAAERFEAPVTGVNSLNDRLFDVSGNSRLELWRVAWNDAESHPIVGSGAGSYSTQWFRDRPNDLEVENAHQLYLETLAELGPPGLALLLVALGAPLAAAWRARRHPLAAGVTAAYVAFLAHVGVDWDWQLAAVSLAGLVCGAALLVMARGSRSRPLGSRSRTALAGGGIAVAAFALWSLHGAHPLGQARDAMDDGEWASAERHATVAVARVGGFSSLAWRLLGESQTALRKPAAARVSLRVAVRRDPTSWRAWYDLAVVARGTERRAAANRALALNPLGTETHTLARVVGITPSPR